MDIERLFRLHAAIRENVDPTFLNYCIAFAFFLYAFDRLVGTFIVSSNTKRVINWSDGQAKFMGATNEIRDVAKSMGNWALTLVVLKPPLIVLSTVIKQPLIDITIVLVLSFIVLVHYEKAIGMFRRNVENDQATNTPMQIKEAWLQLDLNKVGLSLIQMKLILLLAVGHSIAQTSNWLIG